MPQGETAFLSLSANTTTATPLLSWLGNNPIVGTPSLGTTAGTAGTLRLANGTSITTIKAGTSTGAWTLTLPINAGGSGQVLITDGTGNSSWSAATTIPFSDATPLIKNAGTSTQQALFSCANLTGTSTYFLPNNSADTITTIAGTQTLTNKTLGAATIATTQTAGDNSTKLATTAFVTTAVASNATQTTAASPAAITSTTGKMIGLAGAITPVKSGNVLITICGASDPSASTHTLLIKTGTGSAPANGDAATGTTRGIAITPTFTGSVSITFPFSITALVTGLTLNTAIWIDIDASAPSGSVTLTGVCVTAVEV